MEVLERGNKPNQFLPRHWIGVDKRRRKSPENARDFLVSLPPPLLATHALLVGATGSGKTNLVNHLIAQNILLGNSFIVLDPRGDLIASTLALCAGHVHPRKVALLDLREKALPCGFNPLSGKGEPYFRALAVLDALESESESWGVQIAETMRNVLMLLAESGLPLTHIESVFYDRDLLVRCLSRCKSLNVRSFWQRYDSMSPDKQNAIAMPVLNKVSLLLATETLQKILAHASPLDLGRHLNTRGSVLLVSLAIDEMHGAGRMLGRLVLSSICREIFGRVTVPENRRNRVTLFVDEFEHFGYAEFQTILAEGRKYGLSLVLAHQTLAQVAPKLRSMILNNVGVKVIFRCGREDGATLSKDLTGHPQAIDFTNVPVGEAAHWRRGYRAIPIEINAPIVHSEAFRSPFVRSYVQAVNQKNRPFLTKAPGLHLISNPEATFEPAYEPGVGPGPTQKPDSNRVSQQQASHPEEIEDWLCG